MPSQQLQQSSTLPPAQPSYILRGHTAQLHSVRFLRSNLRLLTGDADGWVGLWNLPIKRPVAVWRPHTATVLGLASWGQDRIVTWVANVLTYLDHWADVNHRHGRDGRVHIWQLREEDEADMSKVLPIDDAVTERKQPWLLHTLLVSAINFCSFTSLASAPTNDCEDELLIATPGVQDGSIIVTSFPAESRVATIPPPTRTNTGMLMAIGMYHAASKEDKTNLAVIGGYESGHAALFQANTIGHWECMYVHKAHSQPVLSLAISPPSSTQATVSFFTSSADAIITRHPLPTLHNTAPDSSEAEALQTRHAGQQSLTLRSDSLIFATAGWDGRVRMYSANTMKELAVLKWHKEGCYAVAFAEVKDVEENGGLAKNGDGDGDMIRRDLTVSEKRVERTKATHWLAAGSKDGKVSLWEVY